jgi:hypothetical protein
MAVAASVVPARHALSIDPARALREFAASALLIIVRFETARQCLAGATGQRSAKTAWKTAWMRELGET